MTDLHTIDHYGIGRAMLLRAIRKRASTGDDAAIADIHEALEGLDEIVADGNWWSLVYTACWLAARAEGGNV
jgi:hypothetical protein